MSATPPWLDPPPADWLEQVRAFVAPHAPGEPGLLQVRPWSLLLRIPGDPPSYFKAAAPGGHHEPALVAALARRFPDLVPEPLDVDPERGWLLLPECGAKLRDALDPAAASACWADLLPRYAELQIASADEPGTWTDLGVPDRSPARLPALLDSLLSGGEASEARLGSAERARLAALRPRLEDACDALAAGPVPAGLDHGDLHDGNVLWQDGESRILDWGDACLAHPFTSLLVTLRASEPTRADRLRDAYLEPWGRFAPGPELRRAFARAQWLARLGRALDWAWMLQGTGPAARREWLPRMADWLREWGASAPG